MAMHSKHKIKIAFFYQYYILLSSQTRPPRRESFEDGAAAQNKATPATGAARDTLNFDPARDREMQVSSDDQRITDALGRHVSKRAQRRWIKGAAVAGVN